MKADKPESLFKIGMRVKLKPDARFRYQIHDWTTEYAVIVDTYFDDSSSTLQGKWWYDVECGDGMYSNSYPETDLVSFKLETNMDAKMLLSKEW